MVWVNGEQNSGLANFIPESRLTFVQLDSLSVKRPRRPETDIKDSSEKNNNLKRFRWEHSVRKNGLPLQMFRCSRKFPAGTTKKIRYQPDFPETFCKW